MPRSRLPVEVIEQVIAALVVPPPSVLRYGTPSSTSTDTFRQLCMVNHFMSHICTPLLHSTIAIRNVRQHNALIYTLHQHHCRSNYTQNLWLELPGHTELLHNLLYLLGPGLRRLAITGVTAWRLATLYHVSDALRAHCPDIEEFEYMQNLLADENTFFTHPIDVNWPNMQKLRRLAVDHTNIDERFVRYIRAMPCLDQLVLLNPKWREGDVGIFNRLVDSVRSLQCVHLVFLGAASVIPSVTHIVDKMAELRLESIQELLNIHVIAIIADDERAAIEYTHELISCGDVWSLSSGFIEIEEKVVNMSNL